MSAQRPPLVSIVIATYNRSALLRETVESTLAQTYAAVEVIVVDDGSPDDTRAVMTAYGDRIRYIYQDNQGDFGATATNVGLQAARGEFLCFLDHDDLYLPDKIARQVALVQTNPDVGVAHCGYYYMNAAGKRLEKTVNLPAGSFAELVRGNPIWSGAPLIRRRCLDDIGGYDTAWCGDWRTWLKLSRAGWRFACVQAPLGAYRVMPGSMMSNVAMLERASIETLDRVFAEPDLAPEIEALKPAAYGHMHFFIACRYIAADQPDSGARSIDLALTAQPAWRQAPEALGPLLVDDALSPRVFGPEAFLRAALACLPERATAASAPRWWGALHIGLALRAVGAGDADAARHHFAQALQHDGALARRTDDFARALLDRALRVPTGTPHAFVADVMRQLPPALADLARVRRRVLADLSMADAFQSFADGQRLAVPAQVLAGLRNRPAWALNRGLWAMLVKSIAGVGPRAGAN